MRPPGQSRPACRPCERGRGFATPSPASRGSSRASYECVHGGFDVALANEDPNRLVPLDTVTALVDEGRIGRLHERFYTTTGNGTPVATATGFGREIAEELREAGVEAVLLSGT